jgi:hypothetical protein
MKVLPGSCKSTLCRQYEHCHVAEHVRAIKNWEKISKNNNPAAPQATQLHHMFNQPV